MDELRNRISKYFQQGKLLQLATVSNDRPWVCTVYFVADERLDIFWLSWPTRRHSQELLQNPHAAITVAIKHDLPVIGIQGEGKVELVKDADTVRVIMDQYIQKYNGGHKFYQRFVEGNNQHQMYRFRPSRYVVLDERDGEKNEPQELLLNKD